MIAISSEDRNLTTLFKEAAVLCRIETEEIRPDVLGQLFEREPGGLEVLIVDMRQPSYETASFIDDWAKTRDQSAFTVIPVVREEQALVLIKKYRFSDFLLPTRNMETIAAKLMTLADAQEAAPGTIEDDHLTINLNSYEVRVDGKAVGLTFREFELLKYLVEHAGKAFSRDELLQRIWDYDYFGGTRTVDVHIQRLRAKLGPRAGLNISTVRGVGYMYQKTS